MHTKTFSEFVERHFNYLVTEFGFEIDFMNIYEKPNALAIKYISSESIIVIEADRDQLSLKIKPAEYINGIYVNLHWIVEFLTEKNSTELPRLSFPLMEDQLDYILKIYARLLKSYCRDLLQGDFSWWKDLIMYVIEEMKANYRTTTGMDLPLEAYERLQDYLD